MRGRLAERWVSVRDTGGFASDVVCQTATPSFVAETEERASELNLRR